LRTISTKGEKMKIVDDSYVAMEYELRLDDDNVIDSSDGHGPLGFIQGRGQIIPGLEQALYGMGAGEEKQVVVAPANGYGEFNADLFETLPRNAFDPSVELEEGMGFRMRTEDGQVVIAYVDSVSDDEVVVNLNHPLAGETLHFDVKIVEVREATPEELEGGCGTCGSCGGDCCSDDGDDEGCGCGCGGDCHQH
jgi:FKBP-type peptidyl-prolyl cis-trans isomerase SlyD